MRVGTYNIRHGADVAFDFSILAKDITDHRIDVCGIQEVDECTARNENHQTMEELSALTGMKFFTFTKTIDLQGGGYGTGILSKFPILSHASVPLPSGKYEPRAYGHAVLDVDGRTIDFFNTHLIWSPDPASESYRQEQLQVLFDAVRTLDRWVLTGDFNTEDFSCLRIIENAQLVNNEKVKMNSFEGISAIDNILCPQSAVVSSCGVCDEVRHSDHYLLWADILLA